MGVGAYSGLQSILDAELGLDQGLLSPNPGPFTAPLLSLPQKKKTPEGRQDQLERVVELVPQKHVYLTRNPEGICPGLSLVIGPPLS